MEDDVYLRSDVYFEPLFNKWFVWPYLLAPAPAAMNLANHHLRLMKSFVANASIHAKSANDKAMMGSSLVNIPVSKAPEIKLLIKNTLEKFDDLIDFSNAVKALDELLRCEGKGMSLEPLYVRIPQVLRGLVELHYDLNNQPSFRFVEGLLYHTPYYKTEAQTVCLGILHSSERPFVLSTPRLPDDKHVHIQVPFNHVFVETLFAMRDTPKPLTYIKNLMANFPVEGELEFDSLFTTIAPKKTQAYAGEDIQIRYLGHAGLLIETKTTSLMVDPVIAYRNDDHTNKTTFDDLPPHIDYVVVTHTHMDHVCLETLIQLKHKVGTVLVPKNNSGNLADPSIKLMLKALGFSSVIEMEDMESFEFSDGYFLALPFLGEHADVNIRSKAAWMIDIKGRRILVAADSSNLDEHLYQRLHLLTGDIDILFIGMECTGGPLRWLYGPLLTQPISSEQNESRRFNGSDYRAASYMARTFNAGQVYVYALGIESWFGYFMGLSYNENDTQLVESRRLVNECLARGIPSEQLHGLKILTLSASQQHPKKVLF